MAAEDPLLLRLPFWLVDQGFRLELLLARDPTLSWTRGYSLIPKFELSGPELRFAKALLTRKRNLWLYRCHQGAFAGDFAIVDMSPGSQQHRKVFVIELKTSARLRVGGKSTGLQLANAPKVVSELERIGVAKELGELIIGSEEEVLTYFGADGGV